MTQWTRQVGTLHMTVKRHQLGWGVYINNVVAYIAEGVKARARAIKWIEDKLAEHHQSGLLASPIHLSWSQKQTRDRIARQRGIRVSR